jgi:hypothetical protein
MINPNWLDKVSREIYGWLQINSYSGGRTWRDLARDALHRYYDYEEAAVVEIAFEVKRLVFACHPLGKNIDDIVFQDIARWIVADAIARPQE